MLTAFLRKLDATHISVCFLVKCGDVICYMEIFCIGFKYKCAYSVIIKLGLNLSAHCSLEVPNFYNINPIRKRTPGYYRFKNAVGRQLRCYFKRMLLYKAMELKFSQLKHSPSSLVNIRVSLLLNSN